MPTKKSDIHLIMKKKKKLYIHMVNI